MSPPKQCLYCRVVEVTTLIQIGLKDFGNTGVALAGGRKVIGKVD